MKRLIILLILGGGLASAAAAQRVGIVTGFEGGGALGYAFISASTRIPVDPIVDLVPHATFSYRFYRYQDARGTVNVQSPGALAGLGVRVHVPGFAVTVGPAYEVRHTTWRGPQAAHSAWQHGPVLLGNVFGQVDPRTSLNLSGSFSFANDYGRTRAAVMHRITEVEGPDPVVVSAGAEAMAEGNPEIRALGGGGILALGLPRQRTTFQTRAGYVHVTAGELREGRPYLAVGVVRGW